MPDVSDAIDKALRYLTTTQQKDGSFLSFSSKRQQPFTENYSYSTTFIPALMLSCLTTVNTTMSTEIAGKLARWLLRQRSPQWSFNYWAKQSPERSTMPYPDDLDDTFCALIGLQAYDESFITGSALAQIVKLLITTETELGGPYRTWLVPEESDKIWLDVDLAVNSNIAYFLSRIGNPLPSLDTLMERAISSHTFQSPYYPSVYPLIYYLARAYDGRKQSALRHYILNERRPDGSWETPLHTALAISSLSRLGSQTGLEAACSSLVVAQQKDGSWQAEAFCLDPNRTGQQYFNGSHSLTTAFAIEALSLAQQSKKHKTQQGIFSDKHARMLYDKIVTAAKQQLGALDSDARQSALGMLERFSTKEKAEDIILLPYAFYMSLVQRPAFEEQLFINLGLANLYGWMAFTIYDDFLDNEGDPKLLPVANITMRYSLQYFQQALPKHHAFQPFVSRTFDAIDNANAWEVAHCRFSIGKTKQLTIATLPDYGNLDPLCDRSLGHALTPIAVLLYAGEKLHGPSVSSVIPALRHYIIARQLNDDLHDWESDVGSGRISYVVCEILKDMGVKQKTQDLDKLLPTMRQQFWHHTIVRLCSVIGEHTKQAREALTKTTAVLRTSNVLVKLLDGIDKVNAETLKTVGQVEDFLQSYKGQ